MIELPVTLTSTGGAVSFASPVPLGYTKNKGVYRLLVTAEGEWEGLTIRCFWHLPGGTDPASSLVQDGFVDVPASVTAHPGNGCITFEGSDGVKTVTSADLRYRVGSNSGTEDGTMPEPGTPAWEQLVSETKANADAAEQAKNDAQAAAEGVKTAAAKAEEAAELSTQAGIAASNAADYAKRSAGIATGAADDSALNAENAQKSALSSQQSAENAAASQSAAQASADAAEKSQQSAATDAKTATDAKVAAAGSADAAAGSAVAAGNSASAAAGSEQAAGASEVKAAESEKAAKASEQAAAKSAQAALESKTAAATSEGNAAASAKKAQDVADSLPVDYMTAVNDIAALKTNKADKTELETVKQQVANITPDDSTVGEKPWTSKKIVDTLCQPFEESGNPVQVYPVEGYPLGVKVSWEPVQEGSGDPSPDNVRPIKGRDSITVERCGENLLNIKPFNKFAKNGITFEYVPDGGIHIYGTATANADGPIFPFWHLPPGKYYGMNIDTRVYAAFVVQRNGGNLWLNTKGIFEILAGDVAKYWYAAVPADTTVDETIYPYIVPGTTAPTTYAPYTGDTYNIALPETVYGGEVDAVSGEGKETWKTLTLDGTEMYGRQVTSTPGKYGFTFQVPEIATPTSPSIKGDIVCSQYPTVTAEDTYRCKNGISVEANVNHYFRIYNDTYAGGTIDEWKSYLAAQYAAGTPVQVAYKLVDPVPFTATGTQPILALSGVNTVLTDADTVAVTGRADPIKRITDLEDAVASQT